MATIFELSNAELLSQSFWKRLTPFSFQRIVGSGERFMAADWNKVYESTYPCSRWTIRDSFPTYKDFQSVEHRPFISAMCASQNSIDVSVCDPWSPWMSSSSPYVVHYSSGNKSIEAAGSTACLNVYYQTTNSSFSSRTVENFTTYQFTLNSVSKTMFNADSVFHYAGAGVRDPRVCLHEDRWYISFGASHVWRSSDNGVHWDSLSAPGPVNSLLSYKDKIFVGTRGDSALFVTDGDFSTWRNCALSCGKVIAIIPFGDFVIVAADTSLYESDLTLSVEPQHEVLPRVLYPQPADEFVTVRLSDCEVASIFTLQGVEITRCRVTPNNPTLNTRDLQSGVYVLHVQRRGQTVFRSTLCIGRQ